MILKLSNTLKAKMLNGVKNKVRSSEVRYTNLILICIYCSFCKKNQSVMPMIKKFLELLFITQLRFLCLFNGKVFDQTCDNTSIDYIVTERTLPFSYYCIFLKIMFAYVLYKKKKTSERYTWLWQISYFSKIIRFKFSLEIRLV